MTTRRGTSGGRHKRTDGSSPAEAVVADPATPLNKTDSRPWPLAKTGQVDLFAPFVFVTVNTHRLSAYVRD